MAHGLGLGEARQADRLLALQPAEARLESLRLVEIDAGRVVAADLEDQRLDLRQRPVAGEGRMRGRCRPRRRRWDVPGGSTSQNLLQGGDKGRAVIVGVHFGGGDEEQVVEVRRRAAGATRARPPSTPFSARRSTTSAAGFAQLHGELVEERLVEHLDALHARQAASASFTALAWLMRARREGRLRRAASCGS